MPPTQPGEADIRRYLANDGQDIRLLKEYGADEIRLAIHEGVPVVEFVFRPGEQPLKPVPKALVWEERKGMPPVSIPTRTVGGRRHRPMLKR